MKTMFSKMTLAATLGLALTLTFNACSSDDSDDNGGGSSLEYLRANDPEYQQKKEELKYYDSTDTYNLQRCEKGVVEQKCGDEWYNPLTQTCGGYGIGTYAACGGEIYVKYPSEENNYEICKNNALLKKCRGEWYNPLTHYCVNDKYRIDSITPNMLCGGKPWSWNNSAYKCENEVVMSRCIELKSLSPYRYDTLWYNSETEYCEYVPGGTYIPSGYVLRNKTKCGNIYFTNYGSSRCAEDEKTIEHRCGGTSQYDPNAKWYNPITQTCNGNDYTIKDKTKCGN